MNQNLDLFNRVFLENQDKVYRICRAYCSEEEDIKDLSQEIFINVWKGLDSFKNKSKISTWIYKIAVNTALFFISKQKRNREKLDALELNLESNENATEDKELKEAQFNSLYKGINNLEEMDRLIISLFLEDCSYKEISEVTGLTISYVGVKITRIKEKLSATIK